jgi:hypothetical protein
MSFRGEQIAMVVLPDGMLSNMPAWMSEPSAAQFDIHEPPRFSRESLNDLRRVLDAILSQLDDAARKRPCRDPGAAP